MLSNCSGGDDSLESLGQQGRSNLSTLKEINAEYSLQGLRLKLQYFSHLMQRANSLEKTPMLGKIEGKGGAKRGKRRDGQIASPTQ